MNLTLLFIDDEDDNIGIDINELYHDDLDQDYPLHNKKLVHLYSLFPK